MSAGMSRRLPQIAVLVLLERLTASERRVAALAAEGRSNPEIAQALFVTRKTVETHLGRVYRKLDVSGRAELGPMSWLTAPRPRPVDLVGRFRRSGT